MTNFDIFFCCVILIIAYALYVVFKKGDYYTGKSASSSRTYIDCDDD